MATTLKSPIPREISQKLMESGRVHNASDCYGKLGEKHRNEAHECVRVGRMRVLVDREKAKAVLLEVRELIPETRLQFDLKQSKIENELGLTSEQAAIIMAVGSISFDKGKPFWRLSGPPLLMYIRRPQQASIIEEMGCAILAKSYAELVEATALRRKRAVTTLRPTPKTDYTMPTTVEDAQTAAISNGSFK